MISHMHTYPLKYTCTTTCTCTTNIHPINNNNIIIHIVVSLTKVTLEYRELSVSKDT